MNYKARRVGSIVLGLLSAAGTVVTAILVGKETPKALRKIEELKQNKQNKKIDYVKALIPIYWPAGVVCLGTIASTTISQVMSMRTEASLIATSTMLSQGWNRYKGKVKSILGIEKEKMITNSIASDDYESNKLSKTNPETLFWEEHLGFFSCKKEDLIGAMSDLNQRLHTPDPSPDGTLYWTTLYFLMKDAKANVYDKTKLEASKEIGWTTDYLCEVYELGCMWVHPFYTRVIKKETGEVLFTKITFFEEPIFLEESERSRYNYKSRIDYEHEAECDMHDYDAFSMYSHGYQDDPLDETCGSKIQDIQEAFINTKPDCDSINDTGRRFIPSNSVPSNEYLEDNDNLPSEKDIPIMEESK